MKLTKHLLCSFASLMLVLALSTTLSSCSDNDDNPWSSPLPVDDIPAVVRNLAGTEVWETPVDYSDPYHWAILPTTVDKAYDVFYLQPTTWTRSNGESSRVVDMANGEMRSVGLVWSVLTGYGVFGEHCNVYAPYYRQMDASYTVEITWDDAQELWAYEATKDVTQALDYYFEHCNHGRPFFLAGHSQGAALVKALLAGYFRQHPDYYSRMVAAYPIGYAITTDYLAQNPHLKFAEGADDTGIIISYNTEGADNQSQRSVVVAPSGSLSINPINWKRDGTPATLAENKGSLLVADYQAFYEELLAKGADAAIAAHHTAGLADATVEPGRGVIITHADPSYRHEAAAVFGTGSYHSFDWLFFVDNLKENVAQRIASYEKRRNNS